MQPPTTEPDSSRFEHQVRALTRHVPFRAGATIFNALLSTMGRNGRAPSWLVSDDVEGYPAMELDVSSPFQRRMFYFPQAYWGCLMGLPFGQYIERTLEPGQVFLDIGASIGFYSLFVAERVGPSGRVFSFEPDPMRFESLDRSVRRNGFGWVTCVNAALSDREGEMPFFTVSDGSAPSPVVETPNGSGQVSVRVTRLDDLTRDGTVSPPRIDLIKIDVGADVTRTVAGLKETLARFGYPRVWAEVCGPRGSARAPNTYSEVARDLRDLGYVPFQWKKSILRPIDDSTIQGRDDVLFRHA